MMKIKLIVLMLGCLLTSYAGAIASSVVRSKEILAALKKFVGGDTSSYLSSASLWK